MAVPPWATPSALVLVGDPGIRNKWVKARETHFYPLNCRKDLGKGDRGLSCPGKFPEVHAALSRQHKERAYEWRRILPSLEIFDMIATSFI
jgi:hypothetical protein